MFTPRSIYTTLSAITTGYEIPTFAKIDDYEGMFVMNHLCSQNGLHFYGFKKRTCIHWKPLYVSSTTLYVDYAIYMNFDTSFYALLFLSNFLHVNSRNMYLISMWRFAVVFFLHIYLWCALGSFYCFILWLHCQKWRNKRAYKLCHYQEMLSLLFLKFVYVAELLHCNNWWQFLDWSNWILCSSCVSIWAYSSFGIRDCGRW